MDLGLRGRTAIVSGASSGMGLAIAEALAAEGANVAMFAPSALRASAVASPIPAEAPQTIAVRPLRPRSMR